MSITYRISSTSPDSIRAMLDLVEHDLTAFWAQQGDARLYVHSHLATFAEWLTAVATLHARDWRMPYLNEQGDYYRALEKTLYTVDVYLLF
jgi:hypothetical protein